MVKMGIDDAKLKQYLAKYQSPDATHRDIQSLLYNYKGLHCKLEPYVFNDGSHKELINLEGTIPIKYKGTIYNIPICIWLTDTHPNNAPMCYVRPTCEMSIKVSMYVDHNGKIYLPYLHDWLPHSSNLVGLIQVMIVTFGEHPPVYSKPRADTQGVAMPNPPYPLPVAAGRQNFPNLPPGYSYFGSGGTVNPPPYPTESLAPGGSAFPSFPSYPPYPRATPIYPPGYSGPHNTPYPPATQPSPTVSGNSGNNSGTITEEHIRASLLSAIEDKLRRRLREQFAQLQAELETLRRTQQELTSGSAHLTELFDKLKREKAELEKNINILQDKEAELEKEIAKLSDNQSIDVDEAVSTIAPLYKQMLNAFAEEAAIEDVIYYLGEGLRSGIIDLEAFLKQVRQLSRRQFMLRALMLRCRQKAGLSA